MAFQALYRKWRPDTFADMIGQDAVTATLKNQVLSGRIGHAYLFCGTRGTGKTSAAKILSRAVNCPNAAEHGGEPCNECEICQTIKNGSSMEVFEIDAASNTSVEGIRAIQEEIAYPPIVGKYKVYIIDEVHMLSASAYNALLKTLEEPPAYLIFILATTDPQKLPATVLSRCQRYDFRRLSKRLIEDRFRLILDREGYHVEDKAISHIAELADGSMRDGLSIMDQCLSYAKGGSLSYEDVLKITGAADPSVYSRLYRSILSGDIEGSLIEVGGIINNGADIMQIISDMVNYLRNVLLAGSLREGSADLLDISEERLSMAREDFAMAEKPVLLNMLMAFSELINRARYASDKRLQMEMLIIRLCAGNDKNMGRSVAEGSQDSGRNRPEENIVPERKCPPTDKDRDKDRDKDKDLDKDKDTDRDKDKALVKDRDKDKDLSKGRDNDRDKDKDLSKDKDTDKDKDKDTHRERDSSPRTVSNQAQQGLPISEQLDILKKNWPSMVQELAPSNRKLFSETVLKIEGGQLVLIFKSSLNFKLAAANIKENGVLRLRELASELTGENIMFMARVARPGEISTENDRATDEELASINFHIDIED